MDQQKTGIEDLLCDESFQRYCRGEDEADMQYWESWMASDAGNRSLANAAQRLFNILSLQQGNRMEQMAALNDAIARRAFLQQEILNRQAPQAPIKIRRLKTGRILKYVAAVLVVLTAATMVFMKFGEKRPAALTMYEYHTGSEGRKTVILPDSTIVMLNANSHLLVSRDFDAQHRQVSIRGEAFFDVKHDPAHPFRVNTNRYAIQVLGTTFNVRDYPNSDTSETTLLSGRIEILRNTEGNIKEKLVLKPNQKFRLFAAETAKRGLQQRDSITSNKAEIVQPRINPRSSRLEETSWARSKMELKNRTLEEIAAKLQSWYGITIRFADEHVKAQRYTATFNDETIFNALKYLQQSYPFNYSIENDCIVIAGAD